MPENFDERQLAAGPGTESVECAHQHDVRCHLRDRVGDGNRLPSLGDEIVSVNRKSMGAPSTSGVFQPLHDPGWHSVPENGRLDVPLPHCNVSTMTTMEMMTAAAPTNAMKPYPAVFRPSIMSRPTEIALPVSAGRPTPSAVTAAAERAGDTL